MAEDGSPNNNGEMHYTTSRANHNEHYRSINNTNNENGYSSEERSNSPLDFSFKRKNGDNEISGSDSVPSPASTNDTGLSQDHDDRKISESEEKILMNGLVNKIKSEPDSNWSLNHNVASMLTAFQAGLIPNPMLGPLPSVAALMAPKYPQNKSSSTRPFKSYPKDPLGMGGYIPGLVPSDSHGFQNLNINSEEFFHLYRHHMLLAGEKMHESSQSPLSQSKASSNVTTTSSPSSSSTLSPNGVKNEHSQNGFRNGPSPNGFRNIPSPNGFRNIPSPNGIRPAQLMGISSSTEHRNYTSSRKRARILPEEQKDGAYWERRRKNNEAAKRSRDMRRAKEDEIAIRAALLEQENLKLRVEVASLKTETAKLRCMLYNS
ncbi:GT [Mytilus edulis]|uniref:GT n=1 Tax=Mytilus edulis TaxID=6550 RepID=A0A8S3USZ2_MYTED|nr:GT [Mytilus edulis]